MRNTFDGIGTPRSDAAMLPAEVHGRVVRESASRGAR
jgi:hypothetical protein